MERIVLGLLTSWERLQRMKRCGGEKQESSSDASNHRVIRKYSTERAFCFLCFFPYKPTQEDVTIKLCYLKGKIYKWAYNIAYLDLDENTEVLSK